jgi:peptide/nickel transport system permease protein
VSALASLRTSSRTRRTAFAPRRTAWLARWASKPAVVGLALFAVVATVAPLLAPNDPLAPVGVPFSPPGTDGALLGTDQIGRDILSRVLYGLQTSWFAALGIVCLAMLVGAAVGVVAGLFGGKVDAVLMRATEVCIALPGVIVVIAVVAALGPSMPHTIVALAIVSWPYYARIVRTEIRGLAARPHIEAARVAGESRFRLAVRHLLPGAFPVLVVSITLDLGGLVVALGGLSFLGLGQQPPAPELGAMTSQGMTYVLEYWWVPIMPALAIFVTAMVANLGGDGVRDLMEDR